jgi:glycosyltransferase involved in cell wall biosynthesis
MEAGNLERAGTLTTLIFPTYNPGPVLERTWRELMQFLGCAPGHWEVLFICDGCTDGTPVRLTQLARGQSRRIRILSHTPNRGKGYAVRRGLEMAAGDWRIFTDVDLAYGFEDVLRVAQVLQAGAPVAIASRAHPESRMVLPTRLQGYAYRRHLQSMAFSTLVRWMLPLKYRDTQAGLKGLSAAAARRILPWLSCDGFGFDCELLTACVHFGLAIQEVPVCVRYEDRVSTTGMDAMRRMVKDLWRIRRSWQRLAPPEPLPAVDPDRRAA